MVKEKKMIILLINRIYRSQSDRFFSRSTKLVFRKIRTFIHRKYVFTHTRYSCVYRTISFKDLCTRVFLSRAGRLLYRSLN